MTIKIKEAAVDSADRAQEMIARGANRIELNARLDLGGITPDTRTVIDTLTIAGNIPVVIMVRPRGGDFAYDNTELNQMLETLQIVADLGGQHVTFGVVRNGSLDTDMMSTLIETADTLNLHVVMHMAFDEITKDQQQAAMQWLFTHGVTRILTHGGVLTTAITELMPQLEFLVDRAPVGMTILPGGGVTHDNADEIADVLGISEVHGTKIV